MNNYTQLAVSLANSAHRRLAEKPASVPAKNDLALAAVFAQLAQTETLQQIAVSLAALVELSGSTGNMTDDGELPF